MQEEKEQRWTVNAQASLDIRDLATCVRYFVDEGLPVRTVSEVIRHNIKLVCSMAGTRFEDADSALAYMTSMYLPVGQLRKGSKDRPVQTFYAKMAEDNRALKERSVELARSLFGTNKHNAPDDRD